MGKFIKLNIIYFIFHTCLKCKSVEIPFVGPSRHAHLDIVCCKNSSDEGIFIKVHWKTSRHLGFLCLESRVGRDEASRAPTFPSGMVAALVSLSLAAVDTLGLVSGGPREAEGACGRVLCGSMPFPPHLWAQAAVALQSLLSLPVPCLILVFSTKNQA